jgi:beta-glucosidase
VTLPQGTGFVRYGIPLKCFAGKGVDMTRVTAPFVLQTEGETDFALAEVRLGTDAQVVLPCR